ncbi:hypothetical protein [Marinobacter caseinilyticus]|uniref:hypothetical protein n=1 Tax=Marinobacter caseinilyticus TaxID=2692195 RepID=UPI00140E890B|nr:hypothetical protein [Marinobacter caseinilyticus]
MMTRTKALLLPACALTLVCGLAQAEGLVDRKQDRQTDQAMDPIERIHQTYGPTAAGPGQPGQDQMMERSNERVYGQHKLPEEADTAYKRKRFIFNSNQF